MGDKRSGVLSVGAAAPEPSWPQALRRVQRSDDPFLLEAACIALGQIGGPTAEPELSAVARQGPFLARRAALTALGKLGTPGSRPTVAWAAANDPSARVKATARRLLDGRSRAGAMGD